jgi:hypothetical protein
MLPSLLDTASTFVNELNARYETKNADLFSNKTATGSCMDVFLSYIKTLPLPQDNAIICYGL